MAAVDSSREAHLRHTPGQAGSASNPDQRRNQWRGLRCYGRFQTAVSAGPLWWGTCSSGRAGGTRIEECPERLSWDCAWAEKQGARRVHRLSLYRALEIGSSLVHSSLV